MICSKELWFLTREGGGGAKPVKSSKKKKIVISPSWRKNIC